MKPVRGVDRRGSRFQNNRNIFSLEADMARGRQSKAARDVQSLAPGGQRPAAPSHLTTAQRREWRAIVDRLPADWFTRENHALLVQYCRHVDNANRLAKAIEKTDLATVAGAESFDKLTRMHEREGRAASSLATRMRLTQQSRYNAQSASTAAKNSGTAERKPWES